MQALINLERAWIKARTIGFFDLSDRSRYVSSDAERWASLRFPKPGKPEFKVYCHRFDVRELLPTTRGFPDLGSALDYLNLFLEGTPA